MQELLILAVALTAIGVLIGFGYGIYALRMMGDQPNPSTLRLAALNLLEPSATIGTLLVIGLATDAFNSSQVSPLLLIVGTPLTVMLLAPLFTRAEQPLHRIVVVYGLLRWINTIVLWLIGMTAGDQFIGSETHIILLVALFISGLCILSASVLHIGSSLEGAKIQRVQ